jgi:hypothetical protein
MTTIVTEIRCRRSSACSAREPVRDLAGAFTGAHQGAVLSAADSVLCAPCRVRVAEALTQLPSDLVHLALQLPKPPPGGSGHETGRIALSSPRSEPPWRQHVIDLMEDIERYSGAWAAALAEHLGIEVPLAGRWGHRVRVACTVLRAHLPALFCMPEVEPDRDGIAGALELLWLHERAMAVIGRQRAAPREQVRCPSCRQRDLRMQLDEGYALCSCGKRVAEHDLRAMKTASGLSGAAAGS